MTFKFNSRYVLLTYAQCDDLSEWTILEHISKLGGECIIAREAHSDGGTHFHVFCDAGEGRKFRSRRADYFDVGGYHANITPSRGRPGEGYDYATKDGDIVAGGLARPGAESTTAAENKWSIICRAEDESDFWKLVEELDPKALATNFSNLRRFADWRFKPERVVYEHPSGLQFDLGTVPDLTVWRDEALGDGVVGES